MSTEKNGNAHACASCRHQRKRCNSRCLLAPYFPSSVYQGYVNAHKLFGLCNIQSMISCVEPHQRQVTANTLMLEGTMRKIDPVHGCLSLVHYFKNQIELTQKELDVLNQQLAILRKNQELNQLEMEAMANLERLIYEMTNVQSPFISVRPSFVVPQSSFSSSVGESNTLENEYNYQHAFSNVGECSNSGSKALGKKPMEGNNNTWPYGN